MHFVSALLFGISANIDTLVLGFSYGIQKQRLSIFTNISISLITFFGTLLAIFLGQQMAAFVPLDISRIAGSLLLILLGLYYCIRYLIQKRKQPPKDSSSLHAQSSLILTKKETLTLGMALTLNNAGMGIGASFVGIHFFLTSLITLIFCSLFLFAGNCIGSRWAPAFIQNSGDLLSGLIIVLLGLYELFL